MTLIRWNENCTSSGSLVRSEILYGPDQPKTKQLKRLLARVSQLPLAETYKLLTFRRILDTSCQQLFKRELDVAGDSCQSDYC